MPKNELRSLIDKVHMQMSLQPAFAHLIGIEDTANKLARILLNMRWTIANAASEISFVTCDVPVLTWKISEKGEVYPGYGFGREDVFILLPISPRKLFVALPKSREWNPMLTTKDTNFVNRSIVQSALQRVFGHISCTNVNRMVQEEINQMVYGQNAFTPARDPIE
jgi:hypothetical protein